MASGALVFDTETQKIQLLSKTTGVCGVDDVELCKEMVFDLREDNDFVDMSGFDFENNCIVNAYIDIPDDTDGVGFAGRYKVASNRALLSGRPNANYNGGFIVKYICL